MNDLKEAWFFPNKESFKGLQEYMKIGIPSIGLICMELWCVELMALVAGYISV